MFRSTLALLAICLVLSELDLTETRSINHGELGVEQDVTVGNIKFCMFIIFRVLTVHPNHTFWVGTNMHLCSYKIGSGQLTNVNFNH